MDKELDDLIKKAESGEAHDLYSVGSYYFTLKEYDNAISWYNKSADKNYDLAFSRLILMYHYGMGIDKDYNKALTYLKRWIEVCDEDDTHPLAYLGECYMKGDLVEKNYSKAIEIFKEVFTKNEEYEDDYDETALFWMGKCYENGWGVHKNIDTAIKYYKKGAESSEDCSYALGKLYYDGIEVPQDYNKAFEYLKNESTFNDAIILLGKCYLNGYGTKQNQKKAFELFKELASEDNDEGKRLVIKCYENGWGVKQDYNKVLDLISNFDSEDSWE